MFQEQHKKDQAAVSDQQRASIAALAHDFPKLWQNPQTPNRERKRLVQLLLDDVTLLRNDEITAHVRFKGGITKTLTLPRPLNAWEARKTPAEVVTEIDRLLNHHTEKEIAGLLNQRGLCSGEGLAFHSRTIARIRCNYQLKSRYDRYARRAC